MTRKFLLLLLPLCALFLASSCGPSSATINKMKTEKMAKIGTSPFMPPLVYQKGQEYVGPDAVLANRLVEKMNAEWLQGDPAARKIRLVHVARKTSELTNALKNSEADLIISGYEVTDSRKQELDFSDSYYTSELMLAINPFVNKSLNLTNMRGQKIGVRGGSGAEEVVKSKGAEPVAMGTMDDCVLALKSGEVSGVVDDKYMLAYALDTLPASSHLEISSNSSDEFELRGRRAEGRGRADQVRERRDQERQVRVRDSPRGARCRTRAEGHGSLPCAREGGSECCQAAQHHDLRAERTGQHV